MLTKKDKIQLGFTGCMIVVFVVIAASRMNSMKPNIPPPIEALADADSSPVSINKYDSGLYERLEVEANKLKFKRDPFSKPNIAQTEESVPSLHLQGIAWDKKNKTAMINDAIIENGYKIEGNTVIEIRKDRVILNDGISDFELILGE